MRTREKTVLGVDGRAAAAARAESASRRARTRAGKKHGLRADPCLSSAPFLSSHTRGCDPPPFKGAAQEIGTSWRGIECWCRRRRSPAFRPLRCRQQSPAPLLHTRILLGSQQHKKKTHKRLITFNLHLIFLGASQ